MSDRKYFLPSFTLISNSWTVDRIKNTEIHFDNPSNSSKIELISSMRIIEFQIFPEISSVFTSVSTRRKACNASVPHNAAAWAQGRQRFASFDQKTVFTVTRVHVMFADSETTRTPSPRCDADRVIEFHAILHPFFTLATTWPGLKTNGSNNQFLCRQRRWSSEEREDLSWRGSNENRVMYGDSQEKRDVVAFSIDVSAKCASKFDFKSKDFNILSFGIF